MKDRRWLIVFVVIVAVLVTGICLNNFRNVETTSIFNSAINVDNSDESINWGRFPIFNVELSEDLKIVKSGTYYLTGELEDGYIEIDSGSEGKVRLVLNNVNISNSDGPAISCISGDDLVVELVGDNYLSDSETYASSFDEDITGVIYSKADLVFQGDGRLYLTANYYDGIVGKDDVKFVSGYYEISANDDAIRGKDSVYIKGGDFLLNAGADGIKSTNETDAGKGFVLIEGGNLSIESGAKGMKAIKSVLLKGGNFVINSTDDAIHSDNYVGITGGTYNIASDDDGVHANRELIIDDGNLTISKAYEGLEAQVIRINGGEIEVTAHDDGINAGGGADTSATNRVGAGMFDASEDCQIAINGGNIYVNASGDGIDSNGWLYFNGGSVIVDGPTNNGNGALDAGLGIVMNGGGVLALGTSGMAESLGNSSSVFNVSIFLDEIQAAGTVVQIKDANDELIMSHASAKSFNHIAAGTNAFELGGSYRLYLNDELYTTFTLSDTSTVVGNGGTNQMMPGGGGATPGNGRQGPKMRQ